MTQLIITGFQNSIYTYISQLVSDWKMGKLAEEQGIWIGGSMTSPRWQTNHIWEWIPGESEVRK